MAPPVNLTTLSAELKTQLLTKHLPPSTTWLTNFLSSLNPNSTPPLAALKQTATFRLLNADITSGSIDRIIAGTLATNVVNPTNNGAANGQPPREMVVRGKVLVQVLDIEDITTSRWSQIEAIEARERGEMTKGREIIRVTDVEETSQAQSSTGGTHKLLLQDCAGTRVYAIELGPVRGIGVGVLEIGGKLVLKDVVVARGVILLESGKCEVLGGRVEVLHKAWLEGRKEALRGRIGGEGGG